MNGVAVIKTLLDETYPIFCGVVADLTLPEALHTFDRATIKSIAHIYTHTVVAEDWMIQEVIRGGAKLWETEEWGDRIGLTPKTEYFHFGDELKTINEQQWSDFLAYGKRVKEETYRCLQELSDADLDRYIPSERRTVGFIFSGYAIFHLLEHAGEMAALKGLLGKTGLPD